MAGSWLRTRSLTWAWKLGFRAPLQFHAMIVMTRQWIKVEHSSNGGSNFTSSIKFHPVYLIISFEWYLPGISVSWCCNTPNFNSWKVKSSVNSIIGWNTWMIFLVFWFPMTEVVISLISSILLFDSDSSGSSLHNTEVGENYGTDLQTTFCPTSRFSSSVKKDNHGFGILSQVRFVRGR